MLKKEILTGMLFLSQWGIAQHPLFENYNMQDGLLSPQINDMAFFAGKIWIACGQGLYTLHNGKINKVNTSVLKANPYILHLYATTDTLWMISADGYIFYATGNERIAAYKTDVTVANELSSRIVNEFIAAEGQLYVSTVIGGNLYSFSHSGISYVNKEEDIFRDNDPSFYVYRIESQQVICGSLNASDKKHELLINLYRHPFSVRLNSDVFYAKSNAIITSNQEIWYSKDKELLVIKDSIHYQHYFLDNPIEVIFEDYEGKIWIGLNNGGLLCFPLGVFNMNASFSYLGIKTVTSIVQDDKHNLYFGTVENGIYVLPFIEIAYGEVKPEEKTNGQTHHQAIPLAYRMDTGYVWQGYKIERHAERLLQPTLLLTSFRVDGHDSILRTHYFLPYDVNRIEIEWIGIRDQKPLLMQYKIKVAGWDTVWHYSSINKWEINQLPPGHYQILIYALPPGETWTETPLTIDLTIDLPFWRKKSFWIAGTLVFFLFLSFLVTYIQHRKRKRMLIALTHQRRLLETELMALRAQMNPHFIFNTLASIQNFIEKEHTHDAAAYLNKFSKLIRQVLSNSKKTWISIKDEVNMLKNYIELEQLRLDHSFEYDICIDPDLVTEEEEVPAMMLQPFIENAIWHGLSHKKDGKGKLLVSITKKQHALVIEIADNGIGRMRAAELKSSYHESMGMNLTTERIERINLLLNTHITCTIEDIYDSDQQPAGTKVTIVIPEKSII